VQQTTAVTSEKLSEPALPTERALPEACATTSALEKLLAEVQALCSAEGCVFRVASVLPSVLAFERHLQRILWLYQKLKCTPQFSDLTFNSMQHKLNLAADPKVSAYTRN
jgi:hypothetical protein